MLCQIIWFRTSLFSASLIYWSCQQNWQQPTKNPQTITVRGVLDVLQILQVCRTQFDTNCKDYGTQLTSGSLKITFSFPFPNSSPLKLSARRLETSSKEIVTVAYNSNHQSTDHAEWISALVFPSLRACRNEPRDTCILVPEQ